MTSSLTPDLAAKVLSTTMDSVLLDLERARMEREDFRQGNGPAFPFDGNVVWLSYRKWTRSIINRRDEATDALRSIRTELRDMDGRVPMDIADNYTQMTAEVEAVLGESSDEESDDESED